MRWPEPGRRYLPLAVAALLAAGMQTGVLAWMIESRAAILRDGADIVLRTVPVDPRDLLRGDYVSLSYDISTIPPAKLHPPLPEDGEPHRLYVRVVPGGDGTWAVRSASVQPVKDGEGVVLRTEPLLLPSDAADGSAPLRVRYGIERFYVPEGAGTVLERASATKRLTVHVRVSDAGEAQIHSVMLDGERLFEEPLY